MKIILLLSIYLVSCQTAAPTPDKMDIPAISQEQNHVVAPETPTTAAFVYPKVEAVLNWQKYFDRTSVSNKNRLKIRENLKSWNDTSDANSLLKRARSQHILGQIVVAESLYQELLKIEPHNFDAMIELASTFYERNDLRSCLLMLSQIKNELAIRERPSAEMIFRYRYLLAITSLASDDTKTGRRILSELIGQESGFVPAYIALTKSYLAEGKDDVAQFILDRAFDRCKSDSALFNLKAILEERKGLLARAKRSINKALSQAPYYVPALINRALLTIRDGDYSRAEEDIRSALKIAPMEPDALTVLGIIQQKTGRYEKAKASFQRVIDIQPDHGTARFHLAILLAETLKDEDKAIQLLQEVIQTPRAAPEIKTYARNYLNDLKRSL